MASGVNRTCGFDNRRLRRLAEREPAGEILSDAKDKDTKLKASGSLSRPLIIVRRKRIVVNPTIVDGGRQTGNYAPAKASTVFTVFHRPPT
jgi:hypothetical protein